MVKYALNLAAYFSTIRNEQALLPKCKTLGHPNQCPRPSLLLLTRPLLLKVLQHQAKDLNKTIVFSSRQLEEQDEEEKCFVFIRDWNCECVVFFKLVPDVSCLNS